MTRSSDFFIVLIEICLTSEDKFVIVLLSEVALTSYPP
jgi:hypothetical protein